MSKRKLKGFTRVIVWEPSRAELTHFMAYDGTIALSMTCEWMNTLSHNELRQMHGVVVFPDKESTFIHAAPFAKRAEAKEQAND